MGELIISTEIITPAAVPVAENYEARHRRTLRRERVAQNMGRFAQRRAAEVREFVTRRVPLAPESNFDSQVTGIPDYVSAKYGEFAILLAEPDMSDYRDE